MTSAHNSLDAAATERKARLAKLASLKRKQPPVDHDNAISSETARRPSPDQGSTEEVTKYLSLRNYDAESRGPKLGFEAAPVSDDQATVETRAAQIAAETNAQEEHDAKQRAEGKGIDVFELQPRKPNWDLKRDLSKKLEVLNPRTDNAIAKIVRARLEDQKRQEQKRNPSVRAETGGSLAENSTEDVGIKGSDLVEGIHVRERQQEDDSASSSVEDDNDESGVLLPVG